MTSSPVFVVGCGRSGTTLLRLMLDAHPLLAIPGESHFIPSAYEASRRNPGAAGLADMIQRSEHVQRWALDPALLQARLDQADPSDVRAVIEAFYLVYADMHAAKRWGDKTPKYVLHLPLLIELFPDARFIHLIRDGRSVGLSYLELGRYPRTLEEAALRWVRWVNAGREAGRAMGPRYTEVSYERLVSDPAATLVSLCGFVGLPFNDRMLRYHETAEERLEAGSMTIHQQGVKNAPTEGLRDWRVQMRPEQVRRFEAIAGDTLTELGYERWYPDPDVFERIAVEWHARKDGIHRAGSRARRALTQLGPDRP